MSRYVMKPEIIVVVVVLLIVYIGYQVSRKCKKESTVEPFHRMLRPYIRKTRQQMDHHRSLAQEHISRGYRKLMSYSIY